MFTSSLLASVMPFTEIACKRLQPISVSREPTQGDHARYLQLVATKTEIRNQVDRLQPPAALKETGRSVYFWLEGQGIKTVDLPSWEAFEKQVRDLIEERDRIRGRTQIYVSPVLFRGQPDSRWRLHTTLERSAPDFLKARDYYRAMHGAKDQIESLTEKRWDIWTPPEHERWLASQDAFGIFDFPAYDFMVYLRHHGFPSPLLDWSQSPYIAAFFAFRGASPNADQVAVYAYLEYAGHAKSGSPASPRISGRGPHVRSHRRHVVQQCEYTICTVRSGEEWRYACHEDAFSSHEGYQDLLWKLNIPSSERFTALRTLDRYNLNALSLFGSEDSLMETMALRAFAFRDAP